MFVQLNNIFFFNLSFIFALNLNGVRSNLMINLNLIKNVCLRLRCGPCSSTAATSMPFA